MTARTTQPRPSKGPLGERGRRLWGRLGVVPLCGYHALGRSAGMAARLMVTSCGGGEGGGPTRHLPATRGLVEEPVAAHAVGNAVADMRSLPAGLGKTQRPVLCPPDGYVESAHVSPAQREFGCESLNIIPGARSRLASLRSEV